MLKDLQNGLAGPYQGTVLHPQEFWDKHVSKNLPLVFRGALKESPATRKWTDEYLKEKYGDLLLVFFIALNAHCTISKLQIFFYMW